MIARWVILEEVPADDPVERELHPLLLELPPLLRRSRGLVHHRAKGRDVAPSLLIEVLLLREL